MDQVDVLPLIVTADVVRFSISTIMEDHVDRVSMVFHPKPITNVLAFAINWQRFVVTNAVGPIR